MKQVKQIGIKNFICFDTSELFENTWYDIYYYIGTIIQNRLQEFTQVAAMLALAFVWREKK